jgi:hypothetical protein
MSLGVYVEADRLWVWAFGKGIKSEGLTAEIHAIVKKGAKGFFIISDN